jgi:hypothetical protein
MTANLMSCAVPLARPPGAAQFAYLCSSRIAVLVAIARERISVRNTMLSGAPAAGRPGAGIGVMATAALPDPMLAGNLHMSIRGVGPLRATP